MDDKKEFQGLLNFIKLKNFKFELSCRFVNISERQQNGADGINVNTKSADVVTGKTYPPRQNVPRYVSP